MQKAGFTAGTVVALGAVVLLICSSGAVGITDSKADLLYFIALILGVIGSFVVHFRPKKVAYTLSGTAIALVMAGVIALCTGIVPAHNSA